MELPIFCRGGRVPLVTVSFFIVVMNFEELPTILSCASNYLVADVLTEFIFKLAKEDAAVVFNPPSNKSVDCYYYLNLFGV